MQARNKLTRKQRKVSGTTWNWIKPAEIKNYTCEELQSSWYFWPNCEITAKNTKSTFTPMNIKKRKKCLPKFRTYWFQGKLWNEQRVEIPDLFFFLNKSWSFCKKNRIFRMKNEFRGLLWLNRSIFCAIYNFFSFVKPKRLAASLACDLRWILMLQSYSDLIFFAVKMSATKSPTSQGDVRKRAAKPKEEKVRMPRLFYIVFI